MLFSFTLFVMSTWSTMILLTARRFSCEIFTIMMQTNWNSCRLFDIFHRTLLHTSRKTIRLMCRQCFFHVELPYTVVWQELCWFYRAKKIVLLIRHGKYCVPRLVLNYLSCFAKLMKCRWWRIICSIPLSDNRNVCTWKWIYFAMIAIVSTNRFHSVVYITDLTWHNI